MVLAEVLVEVGVTRTPLVRSAGLSTGTTTGGVVSDVAFVKSVTKMLDSTDGAVTGRVSGAVDGSSKGEGIVFSPEVLRKDPCEGISVTDGIDMSVLGPSAITGTATFASEDIPGLSVIPGTRPTAPETSGRVGGGTNSGAPLVKDGPFITGMSLAGVVMLDRSGTAPVASGTNTGGGGASRVVTGAAMSGGMMPTGTSVAAGSDTVSTAGTVACSTPVLAACDSALASSAALLSSSSIRRCTILGISCT